MEQNVVRRYYNKVRVENSMEIKKYIFCILEKRVYQ